MILTETAVVSLRRQFVDVYGIDNVRTALDRIEAQIADDEANNAAESAALVHAYQTFTGSEPLALKTRCGELTISVERVTNDVGAVTCPFCQLEIDDSERGMADYRLPDGRIVKVDDTAAKGALVIDFTLKGGRIVQAIRVRVAV